MPVLRGRQHETAFVLSRARRGAGVAGGPVVGGGERRRDAAASPWSPTEMQLVSLENGTVSTPMMGDGV